jgi:hypothetical protein
MTMQDLANGFVALLKAGKHDEAAATYNAATSLATRTCPGRWQRAMASRR